MYVSMPRSVFIIATLLLLFSCAGVRAEDAEWISLFDGKTLEGWEKVGNDNSVWEVKDGEINGSLPLPSRNQNQRWRQLGPLLSHDSQTRIRGRLRSSDR
jgi:hypothetical protein